MRALLSPASLKGVLGADAAAAALARGLREAGARRSSCRSPTAARGRRSSCTARSAASGARRASPIRSGGRSRRAGCCSRTGARSWRRRPRSGSRCSRRRSATRCARRAAGSASSSSPRSTAALRRSSSRSAGSATVDGGRRAARGRAAGSRYRTCGAVRRADAPGRRRAALRAAEGRVARRTSSFLEERLGGDGRARPFAALPGSGAAGGLGAALASLGAELVEGAATVLDLVGFDERAAGCDLVVTGEGTVDATTREGKAPGEVARRASAAGIRCVVFGGVVRAEFRAPRRSRSQATLRALKPTSWSSGSGWVGRKAGSSPAVPTEPTTTAVGGLCPPGGGRACSSPTRGASRAIAALGGRRAGPPSPRAASRRPAGAPRRTGGRRRPGARRSEGR